MNQESQVNLERAIRIEAAVEQLRLVVDGGEQLKEPKDEEALRQCIRALRSFGDRFRAAVTERKPRKRKAAKV